MLFKVLLIVGLLLEHTGYHVPADWPALFQPLAGILLPEKCIQVSEDLEWSMLLHGRTCQQQTRVLLNNL
jgi:hypothetical protein